MARGARPHRRTARRVRSRPYTLPSKRVVSKNMYSEKCTKIPDKKEWENAICSVCMECPHNAVLLLCSSHDKGCRPYMCGTSFRHSNCLEQYKKASAKLISSNLEEPQIHTCELKKLTCPLCRGQVKGWTIVEPAREYLNLKKRSCMQEDCSFAGNYKELRKHVKADHPCARPREVDPTLEQKWRRLERERDQDDVISSIRSAMPGAMVFGDYVIERGTYGSDSDEDDDEHLVHHNGHRATSGGTDAGFDSNLVNVFLLLHAFGPSGNRTRQSDETYNRASDDLAISDPTVGGGLDFSDDDGFGNYEDGEGGGMSLASRLRRQGRVLLGRSASRRRRNREANRGSR